MNGLIPTDDPGVEGAFHKLKRLLLNIRKARLFQIADHVRRDTENSSNFIDLEFACFQELRLCFFLFLILSTVPSDSFGNRPGGCCLTGRFD